MKKLILLLLLLPGVAFSLDTGKDLKVLCSQNNANRAIDQLCYTYVAGVLEGFSNGWGLASAYYASDNSELEKHDLFCLPEGSNIRTYSQVVKKYLVDNPDSLNLDAGYIIIASFREAFPCSQG